MNRNLCRYVEDALRGYKDDRQRVKLLEAYLTALAASSPPEVAVAGGERVPEQDRILDRKAKSDELRGLTLKVGAVARFLGTLSSAEAALIRLRYFERLSWARVALEMHASEQACRCRWAPKLMARAAIYFFGDLAKV